jgi:hypothetical protein
MNSKIGYLSLSIFGIFLGCGQAVTGTYVGNEVVTLATGSTQQVASTVSVTQNNNDVIVGTTESGIYGHGVLSGRPGGNVSDNFTLKAQYSGSALSTTVYCGTYIGKGIFTAQGFSVRLQLATPAAIPLPRPTNYPNINAVTDICPSLRVITVSKE